LLPNRSGIEAQTAAYDLDAITEGILSVSRIMNYVITVITASVSEESPGRQGASSQQQVKDFVKSEVTFGYHPGILLEVSGLAYREPAVTG
jgi:hypothetical protein